MPSPRFTTPTERRDTVCPDVTFTLDDVEYTAMAPKLWDWSVLLHAANPEAGAQDVAYAIGRFLERCLSEEDGMQLEMRLRDRHDPLDVPDLQPVVEYLVGEWTPYLGEEYGQLTGQEPPNRAARRAPARRPAAAPARRSTPARTGGAKAADA